MKLTLSTKERASLENLIADWFAKNKPLNQPQKLTVTIKTQDVRKAFILRPLRQVESKQSLSQLHQAIMSLPPDYRERTRSIIQKVGLGKLRSIFLADLMQIASVKEKSILMLEYVLVKAHIGCVWMNELRNDSLARELKNSLWWPSYLR